jgi:hypothetical protein
MTHHSPPVFEAIVNGDELGSYDPVEKITIHLKHGYSYDLTPMEEEDAAFICEAVNSYSDQRALIGELVGALEIVLGDNPAPEYRYHADRANIARAVLSKAKEGMHEA